MVVTSILSLVLTTSVMPTVLTTEYTHTTTTTCMRVTILLMKTGATVLHFGPAHPAAHGVLRLVLVLRGE